MSYDSDIFFPNTEHNSGFHSTRSLDSTIPLPDQERIDWLARVNLADEDFCAGTRSKAYEPGSPLDYPSRERSWSSPAGVDYFLGQRPTIIVTSPQPSRVVLGPSASSTFSGDIFHTVDQEILPSNIPKVAQPLEPLLTKPGNDILKMADLAATKLRFHEDLDSASFYVARARPPPGAVTSQQLVPYQKIMEQVLFYLNNARRGLTHIEHHSEVPGIAPDDLEALKAKHSVVSDKYDAAQDELSLVTINQVTFDQSGNMQAQASRVLDVSSGSQDSQGNTRRKEEAKHQTTLKMELLEVDLDTLTKTVNRYVPTDALLDHKVIEAMKLRNDLRTQSTALIKKLLEIDSSIKSWDLTELQDDAKSLRSMVMFNDQQLLITLTHIERMDTERGIFSDRPAKACPTKLPTFSGDSYEDLLTFRDKFNEAAENNKISRHDQVDKLREQLTGSALNHLPIDGIKDIDHAWEYLNQAFGNPHTCLNHRLAKVTEMPGLTDNIEKQDPAYAAEWYLKMENAVDAVMRMGSRNQSLEYVAFNDRTIYQIIAKLPYTLESMAYKFSHDQNVYGKDKLSRILQLIKDQRHIAHARATDRANETPTATGNQRTIAKGASLTTMPTQQAEQVNQGATTTQATSATKAPRFSSWKDLCKGAAHSYPTVDDVFNSANYGKRPPRFQLNPNGMRLSDCRICLELERSGRNKNVYEGHYGNYPTHCPRWSEMEMEHRDRIARTVGYCLQCMGFKVVVKTNAQISRHVATECVVKHGKKNKYTCLNKECLLHSWICSKHKEENQPLFEAHMQEVTSKQQNLKFCFLTRIPPTKPPRKNRDQPRLIQFLTEPVTVAPEDRIQWIISGLQSPLAKINAHNGNIFESETSNAAARGPMLSASIEELTDGIDLAIPEAMARLKNRTPAGDVLITKVKEPPLFMFSTIPGKDSPAQVFYDGGNSHCLFKKGTPDNLWGCLMKSGPHPLGAVGATTVYGGDCWACQPMLTSGKREVWIGIEVENITTEFPLVNLVEATDEIKASDPENTILQNLIVPEVVGGEVHVLLGIQYIAHHPKHIHSLESGLGIYELRLTPDGPATATIAGPHHSFNLMLEKIGNVSAVIQQFTQGLLQWNESAPPMPEYIPLTSDELEMAARVNITEMLTLEGIADWDNPRTLPSSQMCSTHLTPMPNGLLTLTPDAPKKKPKPKSRINTETREDFLDKDDISEPVLIRCCAKADTAPGIIREFTAANSPCEVLTCGRCPEPVTLRDDEYLELSEDLARVNDASRAGEPLCVVSPSYQIFNGIYAQECDPDLTAMKLYENNLESLVKIEYRCPRCRNCQACREAHETERVSLREEAEQAMITDAVTLDYENKRFICELPLRGKPEEFLTTNKHDAGKILERQVRLYHKEEDTKRLIVKAMDKLFTNGHVSFLKDLPKEQQELILGQPVMYFIPWRVVFKASSISTPARPVFDCSARTPLTVHGSGGRCLNDLMCKGKSISMNLIKMLLKFSIGHTAISGDISQFYNVFKLKPEFWNLQLFLWQEALDPEKPVDIAVIKTLIYGNSASAPLSEEGMRQLAEIVKVYDAELADFLTDGRFVDDLNDSLATLEAALRLRTAVDEEFEKLGAKIKGWAIARMKPAPEISDNGYVGVAGMAWHPESDFVELKFQDLHFGKVVRGRLSPNTKTFKGDKTSITDMENFVPLKLTKRQVTSKVMGIFDMRGLLIPLTARLKRDLRSIGIVTPTWDHGIEMGSRSRWVKNFLDVEKCKGIKFTRPRMPVDAINTKMRLWVLVDAAKELLVVWAGVGFKRRNGKWSTAFLVGRCLLVPMDMTIPRAEMEALVAGSNMLWLLRQILSKWVESFILAGDAQIALFWVLSEKNRLGLWHRTRSVQIRRGTPLDNIYHVTTTANVADIPTRPDRLTLDDLGPSSEWENGRPWMSEEVSDLIKDGTLTPISNMVLQQDDQEEFNEGFVYERGTPECLTRGHLAMVSHETTDPETCPRVLERASVGKYILFPTKYAFPKVVRILSICLKFIRALRKKWSKKEVMFKEPPLHYNSFLLSGKSHDPLPVHTLAFTYTQGMPLTIQFEAYASYYVHDNAEPKVHYSTNGLRLSNDEIQWSLHYLYSTATKEVEHFIKPDRIKKHMVKRDGILFHRGRILDGHRYTQAAGFKDIGGLIAQGLNVFTPVIERWSPLAYSIASWIHRDVGHHSGFETSYRHSLDFCFILQGLSLFETIGKSCILCNKLRARFMQATMGPRDPSSYSIAPAFWVVQSDLFGPLTSYVPGREANTRNNPALPHKVWAMVFVCMLSKAVNIQIVEGHSAPLLADGLTRLCCETGVPARMLIDQDSAFMQLLRDGEVTIVDLETQIRTKTQIDFQLCPVSGHNFHGLVESKINVIQQGLKKIEAGSLRVHATGLQTLMKLVENDINSTPFGVTMGRSELNTPLLKLISPNQLRMGRINSRIPSGPFRLPSGPRDMIHRVQELYECWFKIFNDSLLPQMISQTAPKWYNGDSDIAVGDVVYFRKSEGSAIKGPWTMGMVEKALKGRDLLIREVTIRYYNAEHGNPQYTDRAVRSVVRLFGIDEIDWQQDLDTVARICKETGLGCELPDIHAFASLAQLPLYTNHPVLPCHCCCESHHLYCVNGEEPATFNSPDYMLPHQTTCTVMPALLLPEEDSVLDVAGHYLDIEANQDGFLSAALQLGASMEL